MCLSSDDIKSLGDYVKNVVIKTIENIDNHSISPIPVDNMVCDYCAYKGLCNFSEKYGNCCNDAVKIKNITELLEVEDE